MKKVKAKTGSAAKGTTRSVTLIGLDSIGTVMAEAFLKAGFSTTVWHPSGIKSGKLSANGVRCAATPADAIEAGDLVVFSLKNQKALHQIFETMRGDFSCKTILNLTSGTPEETLKTAKWASNLGFTYLNAGSMVLPPMIGSVG